jgi:periplasmic protein TonB
MSSTHPFYSDTNRVMFNPLANQKKSSFVATGLLTFVICLHLGLAWYLLNAQVETPKPETVIMEVVMQKSTPAIKPAAPAPAPEPPKPVVKKELEKPKPVIKPKPIVKPVIAKKPEPVIKEVVPMPTFLPAPPAPVAPTVTSATTSSTNAPKAIGSSNDAPTVSSGVVALFRVPPEYPARAANRHIEGWVKVEFTVQTDGSVDDAVVISAEPEEIFDDAALTAISKWRFKEKIVNGVAITQRAVQKLQFKLEH